MSAPTAPPEEPVAGPPTSAAPTTLAAPARRLRARQIGLILVGLIVIFSVLEFEDFFAVANARNIATDAAVLLVLAVGIDLRDHHRRHRPVARLGARLLRRRRRQADERSSAARASA